jgi:iron complex transport system ATP-binding protein
MIETVLRTEQLSIGYAEKTVARDLNVGLIPGEVVCLIGPNGAGKSTLLRSISGLQAPLGGEVFYRHRRLDELEPHELARHVSIVTTERVNLGMFTGWGLVSLGRYPYTGWRGSLKDEDRRIVEEAIDAVRASELADRNMGELSDGEKQKLMIARALAQATDVVILDEPTAYLDLPRRVEVMGLLKRLSREQRKGVLLSTHDLDLAIRTSDRLWLLGADGVIEAGAPEDCILSGSLERIFSAESLCFDKRHGSFHIERPHGRRVSLDGGGLHGYWTRRALEREGYDVTPPSEDTRVGVRYEGGERWTVSFLDEGTGAVISEAGSLYELLETVKTYEKPV